MPGHSGPAPRLHTYGSRATAAPACLAPFRVTQWTTSERAARFLREADRPLQRAAQKKRNTQRVLAWQRRCATRALSGRSFPSDCPLFPPFIGQPRPMPSPRVEGKGCLTGVRLRERSRKLPSTTALQSQTL